jgi:hypothetical protein
VNKLEHVEDGNEPFTMTQQKCIRCGEPKCLRRMLHIFKGFLCDACENKGGRSPGLAGILSLVVDKDDSPPEEWQVVDLPDECRSVRYVLDDMVFGF